MDVGTGLDDVEALKHDSLDQVSKLQSTERYQRIMQARAPRAPLPAAAWPLGRGPPTTRPRLPPGG